MNTHRLHPVISLFIIILLATESRAGCIDSIHLTVQPVQCYGLRNGEIEVDTVFGGVRPFYFSSDGQSFSTRPVFESLWAGQYVIIVRDATGCIWQTPVYVPEPEELTVKLTASDTLIDAGAQVELKAQTAPDNIALKQVDWRPSSLFNTQNELTQLVQLFETTTIAIEIRDKSDCVARDQVTVNVEHATVYFPNIFRPGSNQNAYFTVYAGEGVARVLSLTVYSRGGGMVFERTDFEPNDPIKGWNGRWRGKYVQPGVYPWLAVVEFLDGTQQQFHGSVTLME